MSRAGSATTVSGSHFIDCDLDEDCSCRGRALIEGEHLVVCDDASCFEFGETAGILLWDPPFDDVPDVRLPEAEWILAFTSPGRAGEVVDRFGAPAWIFVWDTMSPWALGKRRPLNRSRLCFLYGDLDRYDRDAGLWGEAPPPRSNPKCTYQPLAGRRLADVYSESPRWMEGRVHPHQKPEQWVSAIVGCCKATGPLVDPFAGTGTGAVAAAAAGLESVSVEIEPFYCEHIVDRLKPKPAARQLQIFAEGVAV